MHTQFDDIQYAKLRRSLIRKSAKGTPAQREFLSAARDSAKFLDYMSDAVGLQEGIELEPLADRMSEAEFGNPPSDTEHRLYLAWRDLTPRLACRTAFWGRVTYRHIEEGKIESSFLAVNGGGNVTGAQRIDAALAARGRKRQRGYWMAAFDPYSGGSADCLKHEETARFTSTAPWRGHGGASGWSLKSSEMQARISNNRFWRVLHPETLQYWEEMVTFVVSRNSVFGSLAVRNIVYSGSCRDYFRKSKVSVENSARTETRMPGSELHSGVGRTQRPTARAGAGHHWGHNQSSITRVG